MEYERTSMAHFVEVERLIGEGRTNRAIARMLKCRRELVADVRNGVLTAASLMRAKHEVGKLPPGWVLKVDWEAVEKDIRDGHQLKQIWGEAASPLTSNSNFFKYVKVRFAGLLSATVTLREFKPGEYCEVDWAGDKIDWIDLKTGEIRQAHVFVGILCFSQKIFAYATEDEKKSRWLESHSRMFEFYGGVPGVLVPDRLKNGVIKSHLYDPDLNQDYVELVAHYRTAIVPARSRRPRDKALVENAVGILMRYLRFAYRKRTFTSLAEVNRALADAIAKINSKIHSRFKVSRNERFENLEKATLKPLPLEPYELSTWKNAKLHPDCTISVDCNFYTAPHIYRGKELRVKITANQVAVYLDLERLALHSRLKGKVGERIIDPMHLPENSRAYLETTPQMVLAQARFAHVELHSLIDELFNQDALANLRRAQGLVRRAFSTIQKHGRERANPWLSAAIAQMQRWNRIRCRSFEEFIKAEMKKSAVPVVDRTIVRRSGNPMVRGHGTSTPAGDNQNVPTQQPITSDRLPLRLV
jgi:transposase